jgi:hypothetical protein
MAGGPCEIVKTKRSEPHATGATRDGWQDCPRKCYPRGCIMVSLKGNAL